jgi:hypothetical protein
MEEKFFELLRYSIGASDKMRHLSDEEWQTMYEMAKKQSLIGIVFAGISRLPIEQMPPKIIKLSCYALAEKIAQGNTILDQVAVTVSTKFLNAGYDNCILKGQGNARMYPAPKARTPGDIDIWLYGDIKKIIKLARRKFPKTKACYHHVDFGKYKGVEIEIHYRPAYINNLICNGRMQRWFRQMAPKQMTNRIVLQSPSEEISVPTLAFNRIFQMAHISNHVIQEGIGLRQLLDYYYLLMQGFSEEEKMNDERLLRRFGLYHVAAAVMYVLHEVFGLKQEQMIVPMDERRGRFLLEEIMISGNFGRYDKRLVGKRSAIDKNISRLKRDFRFLRYFPSECLWEPVFRIYHFFWRMSH